jgi:hypothetical protein
LLHEHAAEEGYKSMDFNPAIAGYSATIQAGLDENPDYFYVLYLSNKFPPFPIQVFNQISN